MVLPFLLKDHVQAPEHRVVLVRVAGSGGSDAGTLQLVFSVLAIATATSSIRSRRRSRTWSRVGSASGSMPQRRGLVSHDPASPHEW